MKQNNLKTLIGATALCATLGMQQVAQAVVTAPVGYVKVTMNAEADSSFSIPMNRPKVYSGVSSSVIGNVISVGNDDFTSDEFVYDIVNQNERYYVIFTTGSLEGRRFDVVSNSNNSITVDPDHTSDDDSQDLESLLSTSNDSFEVRPHWTLNTAFPDGGVLPASSSRFSPNGLILEYSSTQTGTDLPPSAAYFYVTGSGWRESFSGNEAFDDTILRNDLSYVFRNTEEEVDVNFIGDVPTVDQSITLNEKIVANDNYVGFQYPIDLSLQDLALGGSANFNSSSSRFSPDGDLLIVRATGQGLNTPAESAYFYVEGSDGGTWFDSLTLGLPAIITADVIEAGRGYIIRTNDPTAAEDDVLIHRVTLPYNPFSE